MQMWMRGGVILAMAMAAAVWGTPASGQRVEFNYNGRIKAQGQPFNGTGQFKFALTNENGAVTCWANDGATLDGSEPTASVASPVVKGSFSVNIGDTTLPGMAELDASLFNDKDRVYLRVWFSNGTHGFERLLPDVAVANPSLLGGQSLKELHLYVNPATGNDQNPGLQAGRPKQTIQSAWNALPPMIRRNATIHLAAGVYREEVTMKGKLLIGDAQITIVGNEANPTAVRVTGSNASADTTAVRARGFHFESQKGVAVKGILFNYTTTSTLTTTTGAITLERGADVIVENCKFLMNAAGITSMGSTIEVAGCEFAGPSKNDNYYGIQVHTQSRGDIKSCNFHDLKVGISINRLAVGNITGTTINSCFIGGAFGNLAEVEIYPTTTVTGCNLGISCFFNSITKGSMSITYGGNGTNRQTSDGGVFYL